MVKGPFDPSQWDLLMRLCGENVVNLHKALCCLDPGLVCVVSSRSAFSHLRTFSVQNNIHVQIRVDGKVDRLVVGCLLSSGRCQIQLEKTVLVSLFSALDGDLSFRAGLLFWGPERSGVVSSEALSGRSSRV